MKAYRQNRISAQHGKHKNKQNNITSPGGSMSEWFSVLAPNSLELNPKEQKMTGIICKDVSEHQCEQVDPPCFLF